MFPPFLPLYLRFAMLAMEAQQVIFLRMLRVAAGGPAANREMHRMQTEKMTAALQIGTQAAIAAATGQTAAAIATAAIGGYRKRVGANRRRLTRG